jgi:tRNA(Ile)-lysidine synthetase-like protein
VLLGLVASGSPQRIKARREDGVVRPLLGVWREEVRAWCDERGVAYREDSSNPGTKRGLIRAEILPLLERLDPRARSSLLSLADDRPRLPRALERALAELLAHREGSQQADLGGGVRAVREYDTLRLEGTVTWGPWTLESARPGLEVRARRPGDHLAGRRKKVQDLFVDAKVPRSERDSWPVVVHGEDVVAVPGVAEAPGWEGAVTWRR